MKIFINMKIGDKLICKKSVSEIQDRLTLNKNYIIYNIFGDSVDDYIVVVENDNNSKTFFLTDSNSFWYIWDYFYTKDELRIKKLKTLI
jgi:hypothetical protein